MRRFLLLLLSLVLVGTMAAGEGFVVTEEEDEDFFGDDGLVPVEVTPAPAELQPIAWDQKVSPNEPNEACYGADNMSYHDDSIDVQVTTFHHENGTLVYAMAITLTDVSQFRVGTAANREPYQQTALVSTLSKRFHAVCAINDDYFGYHTEGVVVRSGKTIRVRPVTARDELIVDMNGDFHIITGTTREKWDAYDGTVLHAFCFGPALVIDGRMNENAGNTTLNLGKNKKTQRIAIGQTGPLQYLVLACDGPENDENSGLTIAEMAQLCEEQGMINGYNLDGGSSSTMVMNNKKINAVGSKKRPVGGCIWFATLVPNE